jgi:hypothetical protein
MLMNLIFFRVEFAAGFSFVLSGPAEELRENDNVRKVYLGDGITNTNFIVDDQGELFVVRVTGQS